MKKVIVAVLFIGSIALAINFSGSQSLNGLQSTKIFTAPTNTFYFLKGYLSLPQISTGGGASQVEAVVSKNGTTVVYDGVSGASGFSINALSLTTGDAIHVQLKSGAAVDQPLNAVSGQVYYGNGL